MVKNAQYFLEILGKTSRDSWTSGEFTDRKDSKKDVYGHLGAYWDGPNRTGVYRSTADVDSFRGLLWRHGFLPAQVADGNHPGFPHEHPQDRILACLRVIQEKERIALLEDELAERSE